MKNISINATVYVKISETGYQILKDRYSFLLTQKIPELKEGAAQKMYEEHINPKKDENGYCHFQLWHLIYLFGGSEILKSYHSPFEGGINIEEEDIKDADEVEKQIEADKKKEEAKTKKKTRTSTKKD